MPRYEPNCRPFPHAMDKGYRQRRLRHSNNRFDATPFSCLIIQSVMPQTKWLILALGLVFAPIQAVAQTIALDAKLFDAVLRTARDYAADRNLIFYCLRKDDQMSPFLYAAVHLDIAYALQLLRAAGADDRQRAQMIEAILRNIRSASRE